MAKDRLSKKQFRHLADILAGKHKPTIEGFSIKAFGPRVGQRATNAYMVGITGVDFPDRNPTGSEIEEVANANEAALRRSEMYFGGWGGQQPPRASLDVSQRFPRGMRQAQASALRTAAFYNQEAIGIVGPAGEYAGELRNPHYVSGAPQTGQPLTKEMIAWAYEPLKTRRIVTVKPSGLKKIKTLPSRNPFGEL